MNGEKRFWDSSFERSFKPLKNGENRNFDISVIFTPCKPICIYFYILNGLIFRAPNLRKKMIPKQNHSTCFENFSNQHGIRNIRVGLFGARNRFLTKTVHQINVFYTLL